MKIRFIPAVALLAACSIGSAAALIRTSTVAWDPVWKDGKAEIVTYAVAGDSFRASVCQVSLRLRSVDRGDAYGQFEMVRLSSRRAGADPRQERMSILFDRRLSHSEGMTFSNGADSVGVGPGGHPIWYRRSVYDTLEVHAPQLLSSADHLEYICYDALPIWLRGKELEAPGRDSVLMIPPLSLDGNLDLTPIPTEIEVIGPAGPPSETSHGGLQVNVHYGDKVDRLWFHPGPGHVMLVWERADGTTLTFRKSERR